MKFRKYIYIAGAVLCFVLVLVYDVVRKSVPLDSPSLVWFRHILTVTEFFLLYLFIDEVKDKSDKSPVRKLGFILLLVLGLLLLFSVGSPSPFSGYNSFDQEGSVLVPKDYMVIFLASILDVAAGIMCILILLYIRDLIFIKRKQGTRKNFTILLILIFAALATRLEPDALKYGTLTNILLGFAILLIVINSFRLSWIPYLKKREKVFSLLYGFFLVPLFIGLAIFAAEQNFFFRRALEYYSQPLQFFVFLMSIFGAAYVGIAFISTLFHLPTAEVFDRKLTEISSLHNLGRLVTEVFDFNNLVENVTNLTLEICEAKSSWLELIHRNDGKEPAPEYTDAALESTITGKQDYDVHVVSHKNITLDEIRAINTGADRPFRDIIYETKKAMLFDNVAHDKRTRYIQQLNRKIASLLIVPLISHTEVIGILYATKDMAFGFEKEDVDAAAAFADQVTIALENARLIEQSIEKERLEQELMVAQEMQRRLLPQSLPHFDNLDIDAVSYPAYEVGGDYYDFAYLGEKKLGIVIGDVSGKGVSAAFYMAVVKGIFQSLSKICESAKDLLIRTNRSLNGNIDKRFFVSMIYAIIDIERGILSFARAGHCPMLYVSRGEVELVRPNGLGLGLDSGPLFDDVIEEKEIKLATNDVCVFYTDGVTESRNRTGEEFGSNRLVQLVANVQGKTASEIRSNIVSAVREHTGNVTELDDISMVVLKWRSS
jgi:serine phosphatase RsbU (regulator of sigma subunit)